MTRLLPFLYQQCITWRHHFYKSNFFKSEKVNGAFVVCVGNIVAGGTGKTPLIVKLLEDLGMTDVALLSRGYQRPWFPKKGTWEEVGDEPALIRRRFPHISLYVDRDRVRGAKKAVKEGHRLILMDDGLQHLRLKKDMTLVMVDGEDPWGGGEFLPWGRLRDLPQMLYQQDLLVVKGPPFPSLNRKTVEMRMIPKGVFDLAGNPLEIPDKIALFSGIAKPYQFKKIILRMKDVVGVVEEVVVEVVDELILGDHRGVNLGVIQRFSEMARKKGAKMLLCTEKDMVKLTGFPKLSLPIGWLKVGLEVVGGHDLWSRCVKRIYNEAMG